MKREYDNENRIHLYGLGQYWAAFDKSAYLFKHRDIGPSNEEHYNEDGDHYYYDRKLIRYKQQHKSNKDK